MPFQQVNVAGIRPIGAPWARDLGPMLENALTQSLQRRMGRQQMEMRAQQMAEEPQRFAAEQHSRALMDALKQAQIDQVKAQAQQPFGGRIPPGAVGQAIWLGMVKQRYGEDSPEFQQASQALQSQQESAQILNEYRKGLLESMGKRFASPTGKLQMELEAAQQGAAPGGPTLSPEDQAKVNQLQLAIQKKVSDPQARQRNLFASNIEKTLDLIDPEHLTQYAGIPGEIKKRQEEAKAPFGKESEDYRNYQKSLTAANTLATQVRQFYGDSINPAMVRRLEVLTNPASWRNNPKIARQNFDQIKEILKRETKTYREALKTPRAFESGEEGRGEKELTFNPNSGRFE